ncbi:substrate-binding and vWA domain-containing protein [Bifidobacterium leontopitheci]|uniref:von Willebrand factor type A (VWA) domain-containing protein n=1 Tax=Bifidobacterium leontopitheci TaxID=2650774 RepID=A0A6I1GKB5_9BIFI|nr:VWA domain-containing protein [Bifidobacterium leontopitheci]KAB7789879.1 von Willebrand factor type A (vWA) domain-containing protein [Bifidobacterium leontopitheci]
MTHSTQQQALSGASRNAPQRTLRTRLMAATAALTAAVMLLAGCSSGGNGGDDGTTTTDPSKSQTFTPKNGGSSDTLKIASGSENREVAAAIQQAADESGVTVQLDYMGSLDIMQSLKRGGDQYDAVWPASSMWISMGDTQHIVKDEQSTSTTPIVFGIAKQKAVKLGWADASGKTKPVSTADLIKAVQSGDLTFSMTSATQSNSGASAYLAFLTALSGKNEALTAADLDDSALQQNMKTLLSGVNRSSGSSDWLKDMVVKDSGRFDSMVNYESLVIAADKELTAAGKDPLLAVYPSDGIAVSDSPLGYVDRGQKLDDAFAKFQKALSSKASKRLFEQAGRRTGLGGALAYATDAKVKESFRAEWGITTGSDSLKAIAMPSATVITKALDVYQRNLRKPSWTVWVVDYSGSMYGEGKDGVVGGLKAALDPRKAAQSMIEPGSNDVNILIPFNSNAMDAIKAQGTDTASLIDQARTLDPSGGTNIYDGLVQALYNMPSDPSLYTTAIVLMTDGQSSTQDKTKFTNIYQQNTFQPPVFSIMFAEADPTQLNDLAELSNAKVFDGRKGDLADVFRQVKGYN